MNIREATTQWVNGFNAIPQSIIQKLIGIDWDEVKELTPPTAYDRVYTNSCKYGEIVKVSNADDDLYLIRLDDSDKKVEMHGNDFTVIHDDLLPMWGTMWSFGDSADNWWLERGGIETMANCGFRCIRQED